MRAEIITLRAIALKLFATHKKAQLLTKAEIITLRAIALKQGNLAAYGVVSEQRS